jgi:hypothetical protein
MYLGSYLVGLPIGFKAVSSNASGLNVNEILDVWLNGLPRGFWIIFGCALYSPHDRFLKLCLSKLDLTQVYEVIHFAVIYHYLRCGDCLVVKVIKFLGFLLHVAYKLDDLWGVDHIVFAKLIFSVILHVVSLSLHV